jgi:hypothetical protein
MTSETRDCSVELLPREAGAQASQDESCGLIVDQQIMQLGAKYLAQDGTVGGAGGDGERKGFVKTQHAARVNLANSKTDT